MKTFHFFFASVILSLLLVSCQKETIPPSQTVADLSVVSTSKEIVEDGTAFKGNAVISIRHIVAVHLDIDKSICNRYLVQVTDGLGNVIASENYSPETPTYTFYEQAHSSYGIRIVRLVQVTWPEHFVCDTELFTRSDIQALNFTDGGSYDFNLYPKTNPSKMNE